MFNSEYIVTLRKGVDPENFKDMMTSPGGPEYIPTREVLVVNERPASIRSTEYAITDEEAQELRKHPDVLAVETDRHHDFKRVHAVQHGNFQRSIINMNPYSLNWGLRRTAMESFDFVKNIRGDYEYTLDGTGVDVVIQDDGVWPDHPEFLDDEGNSRVIEHNWYFEAGLSDSMPAGHYGTTADNYHGTHVAGIACGKYHGYAKGARIYSIRFDSAGGLATNEEFDLVRLWHERKPIDPETGYKRPTIVNASWGYSWYLPQWAPNASVYEYYDNITELGFRGTVESNPSTSESYLRTKQFAPKGKRVGLSLAYVDAAVEDMIEAGVIFVTAAGNTEWKQDVPGGQDYDNYVKSSSFWPNFGSIADATVLSGDPIYYNRKGSPTTSNAINVGSVDNATVGATNSDFRSSFSEKGPRVDVYAPGSNVISAGSPASTQFRFYELLGSQQYVSNYRDTEFYNLRIGGTSMASPQVTGVLALFLQLNPWATQDDCRRFLENQGSKPGLYDTGEDDATKRYSTLGSPNRYLFNPYAVDRSYVNKPTGIPTFNLAVDDTHLDEENEEQVVVTLTTTNIADNTVLTYTITGIDELDLHEGTTGNFVVVNNTASVTLTANADFRSDGVKMCRLKLDDYRVACFFQINDTSNVDFGLIIEEDSDKRTGTPTVYANKTWTIKITAFNFQEGVDYTYRWFFNGPFNDSLINPFAGAPTSELSQFTLTPENPSYEITYQIGPYGADFNITGTWYLAQADTSDFFNNGYGLVNGAQINFEMARVARPEWTSEFISDYANPDGTIPEGSPFKLRMIADDPQYAPPGTRIYYKQGGDTTPFNDVSGFSSNGYFTVTRSDGILEVSGYANRDNQVEGPEVFALLLSYSSQIYSSTVIGVVSMTIVDS